MERKGDHESEKKGLPQVEQRLLKTTEKNWKTKVLAKWKKVEYRRRCLVTMWIFLIAFMLVRSEDLHSLIL